MMKDSVKRIMTAVCAAAMAIMLTAGSAMASATVRPQPDSSGETTTMTTSSGETGETSTGDTAAGDASANQASSVVDTANSVTQVNTGREERSYQTRLGGFLWFLLSVIVNFIISCWVGNRFYRLARRSNQSSAEIRALRKDIEEKFGSTLRDISEPAIEVMNQNENYARTDEGLSMPDRQNKIELNDEEREMFRKWDEQRANARAGAKSARTTRERREEREADYEEEDDFEEEEQRRPASSSKRRSAYQPTRSSSGIRFDDDEDEEDDDIYDEYEDDYEDSRSSSGRRPSAMNERREKRTSNKVNKAKGKAKDFLSNMFPFDD